MIASQASSTKHTLYIGFVSLSLSISDLISLESRFAWFLQKEVGIKDGETAFTLTPFRASSMAADLVSISRPAFDMQ